ncbi:MAG TPA: hypothetical protein VNI01_10260, partial [Elusimicrobiota bacterium]|nr:hypothetical protein [Elusimicrobiota bacterium]
MKAALALFLAAPPAFAASVQVRAVAAPSIGAVPAALAPLPAASPLLDLPSFPALSAISAGVAPELAVPAPEAAPALSLAQSGVEASPALAAALPTANAVADEGPSSALDGEARAPERPRAQDELSRLSSGRADARAAFDGARGAAPSPGESAAAVAERGAFELEKDADRLFAGLSRIHDLEMREAAPAAELNVQKLAFLRELDAVARALPAVPGPSFADVQRGLADAHSRREEAGRRLEELRRAKDWRALADAGRALAAARREVLAHQLGVARLILLGRSGLRAKALRRNAALWTFAGAVSTAARLAAETRWYERAARMRRVAEGETGALSVSRRRWINAATTLRDAARDARNGRGERARARTAFLASLYEGSTRDAAGPDLPRRYREIA